MAETATLFYERNYEITWFIWLIDWLIVLIGQISRCCLATAQCWRCWRRSGHVQTDACKRRKCAVKYCCYRRPHGCYCPCWSAVYGLFDLLWTALWTCIQMSVPLTHFHVACILHKQLLIIHVIKLIDVPSIENNIQLEIRWTIDPRCVSKVFWGVWGAWHEFRIPLLGCFPWIIFYLCVGIHSKLIIMNNAQYHKTITHPNYPAKHKVQMKGAQKERKKKKKKLYVERELVIEIDTYIYI